MTDFLLLENIHRLIKDTRKPRLMHKKGICVKGYFRPFMSLYDYTESEIFGSVENVTPVSIRFSSMLGDNGTADSKRNIKCMSVKFHSSDGEYDMICQNLPVFFINDEKKFIDLIKAFSNNNMFDGINREELWRFLIKNPEAVNCILRMYSYEGLRDSYVFGKWFSVNRIVWSNHAGKKYNIRYKWTDGTKNVRTFLHNDNEKTRIYAEFMSGFDPDKAGDELRRLISDGEFPQYNLYVQVAENLTEEKYTLCWEKDFTEIEAGVMKITEIIEDSLSFDPGNITKGIALGTDDFSQFMSFAHKLGKRERLA